MAEGADTAHHKFHKIMVRVDFQAVAVALRPEIHHRRAFKDHFGFSPETVSHIWDNLSGLCPIGARPVHLLWLLYWWKTYAVTGVCAAFCKCDSKTFMKWRTDMQYAVASMDNINFIDRFDGRNGRTMLAYVSVDGTDCPIEEPSPFTADWYSHKLNAAGLRYEIGVCIQTGKIVWVNGPYRPGPWPDLNIFRDRLIYALEPNEWIVGDKGYRDGFEFVIPKESGPEWFQDMTAKVTARHETINSRFKRFKVLSTPFRHGLETHEMVFAAIASAVQCDLEVHPPFAVVYDDTDINRIDLI